MRAAAREGVSMNKYRTVGWARRWHTILSVSLAGLLALQQLAAAPVHVTVETRRGLEYGAGISVGRGPECFVVAPLHVVEFAREITITDRRGRSAAAIRYQAPEGVDAILLKVEDGHSLDCPEDWDDGSAAEGIVYDVPFLVSKKVKDGGIDQRRFFPGSVTPTSIQLQPFSANASDRLMEGDSGSALYAQNRPLGMIVAVDTATGEGEAIKQSQLHALFANYVMEQSARVALISPVYYRNSENPYATVAMVDFLSANSTFDVREMPPNVAAANQLAARQGIAAEYPDDADYVISGVIIKESARRVPNPQYEAESARESNFGKQLLNSLTSKTFRYYVDSNVDVEISITLPKENRTLTHIERLQYRTPLTESTNEGDIQQDAWVKASIDALRAAMIKYDMPVNVELEARDTGIPVPSFAPEEEPQKKNLVEKLLQLNR